jgi:hypothetical protein
MAKRYVLECNECGSHKILVSLWGECDEEDGSYQLAEISPSTPHSVGWCEDCDKCIGTNFYHKIAHMEDAAL